MGATSPPTRRSPRTSNGRRARRVLASALTDLERLRADGGISLRRLATQADVDAGYLSQILAGHREPSISVLVALATALGADLSLRAYPAGGPVIRDRIQARIVEEVLHIAARSWDRFVEVPVVRPARGFIDVVLDSPAMATIVAIEVESRLDRLEEELRRAQDKADSLPSADLWRFGVADRTIGRLLVLRSTLQTRQIARRFESTLRAAYPARAIDAHTSLTTTGASWPGNGILWADVHGDMVRVLDRPPRGVALGR